MTTPDYDYRGLTVSTWDLWRGDTSAWDDRFFYLDIVRQYGEPALDVGCGTGRIVLDYLQQGVDIDGLDNSPEMLALCRAKAEKLGLSPHLYQQRMEQLDLPRTYRTILVPSSSFQHMTTVDMARAAMRGFWTHLQSGGALVMPFGSIWNEDTPLETDWIQVFERVRPEDGATVTFWGKWRGDLVNQHWYAEERFEVKLNGEVIATEYQQRSPEGRWYTQAQAVQLYQDAGFTSIQVFHEFTRTPAAPDDELFSVLGVKP